MQTIYKAGHIVNKGKKLENIWKDIIKKLIYLGYMIVI